MTIRPIDTLLAIKAIIFMPGLNEADRQIGAAIVEHFNRRTGQCDPSHGRLSRLLRIGERTVMRSIPRLEKAGILRRVRHGGNLGRNAYQPDWARLSAMNEAWNEKFAEGSAARRRDVSPVPRQHRQVGGDPAVTQTSVTNLQKETSPGLWKGRPARPPAPPSSRLSAEGAAERRWNEDVRHHFAGDPKGYANAVDTIDMVTAAEATHAELRKRGTGLWVIVGYLRGPRVLPEGEPPAVGSNPDGSSGVSTEPKVDTVDDG